jgi:hypothetical protein
MSRPGRFALRVLAVTALSFGLLAPASFGQAASLTTESLESNPAAGQQTTFGAFTCNKAGTTTISFQSQGSALGPYVGTFIETGTITIGPQTDTSIDSRGVGAILGFEATFTIDSQFPVGTVTGTKQLSPTAPTEPSLAGGFGSCDPDGSSPPNDVAAIITNPNLLYQAQIDATTGSRTDSGTASMVMRSIPPPLTNTFQQIFISTEPEACEDGNNGNGSGAGHDKKKNDNDEEEDC